MNIKAIGAAVLVLIFLAGCGSSDSSPPVENVLADLSFPDTPEKINAVADQAIAATEKRARAIMDASPRTFENTIAAFDALYYEGIRAISGVGSLISLSPSRELRDAAREAGMRVSACMFELMTQDAFVDALTAAGESDARLGPAEKVLRQSVQRILRFLGAEASGADRLGILQLHAEIQRLEGAIQAYLGTGYEANALPTLIELVQKRAELAEGTGYDSYAAYILQGSLAKTPETAMDFLKELSVAIDGKFQEEVAALLALKREKTKDNQASFFITDYGSYRADYLKDKFGVSVLDERLFPLEACRQAAFEVAEAVLGVTIREAEPSCALWCDGASYYIAEDARTGEPVGSFYFDPFKRENKLDHPRLEILDYGKRVSHGVRNLPAVILITDFTEPEAGDPAMLTFSNVRSFFHEFGHTLQYLLARNNYLFTSRYFPINLDSVEIHSQLFEQWLTVPRVLKTISGRDEGLSELQATYIRINEALTVLSERWHIAEALYDLRLFHDGGQGDAIDPIAVYNNALAEHFLPYPNGDGKPTGMLFYQLANACNVYGYSWTEVIALDIADLFSASSFGLMDPRLGAKLKTHLYTPDRSVPLADSIRAFLGRDWNAEAFYEHCGVH